MTPQAAADRRDDGPDGTPGGQVAAWIGDDPVPAAEVAAAVARLRRGPGGPWLASDDTVGGRQLRREVTQRLLLHRLLDRELAAQPEPTEVDPARADRTRADGSWGVDRGRFDPALLGGALADVLAAHPAAGILFAAVTAAVTVRGDDEVRSYYQRNPDRFAARGVPYPAAHDEIVAWLTGRRRQRAFARWVDERYAALVRLEPGYEHPGDPRQPDATHRH